MRRANFLVALVALLFSAPSMGHPTPTETRRHESVCASLKLPILALKPDFLPRLLDYYIQMNATTWHRTTTIDALKDMLNTTDVQEAGHWTEQLMSAYHRPHHDTSKPPSNKEIGTHVSPYCEGRGSTRRSDHDGFLCSACAARRRLPAGHFPEFINEVVCNPNEDQGCLYLSDARTHGTCKQRDVKTVILQKTRHCFTLENNASLSVLEEWRPTFHTLGGGCDCAVSPKYYTGRRK